MASSSKCNWIVSELLEYTSNISSRVTVRYGRNDLALADLHSCDTAGGNQFGVERCKGKVTPQGQLQICRIIARQPVGDCELVGIGKDTLGGP